MSQDAPRALAEIAEGWIAPRLGPFGGWVGSVVPRGYLAYARVLHPVERGDGGRPARWADVCAATGRRAHALMQGRRIAGVVEHTDTSAGHPVTTSTSRWPDGERYEGSLAAEPLGHLLDVLAGHTDAGLGCYFALWDGFGWIHGSPAVVSFSAGDTAANDGTENGAAADDGADDGPGQVPPAFPPEVQHGPRLRLPHRDYLLFSGPLNR